MLPAPVVGKLTPESNKNEDGATNTNSTSTTAVVKPVAGSVPTKAGIHNVDLQAKVNSNTSVITVVNTPITVVKSIGGAAVGGTPFSINPAASNPSTITLVSTTPVAKGDITNNGGLPVAPVNDKQQSGIHNVFVKKSAPAEGGGISVPDMPQSHKLLTANPFPPTNVCISFMVVTRFYYCFLL